jgi:hypothetical protein
VVRKSTAETEAVSAIAVNGRNNLVEIAFLHCAVHSVHTIRCWAPFEVLFIVHICAYKQFLVTIRQVIGDKQV